MFLLVVVRLFSVGSVFMKCWKYGVMVVIWVCCSIILDSYI